MQERILSTRCLHLSEWGATFQCQELVLPEHHFDMNEMDSWHGQSMPVLSPMISADLKKPSLWVCLETYASLVKNYSGIQLSFPSDALNAFSGILSAIEHYSDDQSQSGVPLKFLRASLLWTPIGHGAGANTANNRSEELRNPEFPSWAWADWMTQVSFSLARFIFDVEPRLHRLCLNAATCSFVNNKPLINSPLQSSPKSLHKTLQIRTQIRSAKNFISVSESHSISYIYFTAFKPNPFRRVMHHGKLFGFPIQLISSPSKPVYSFIRLFQLAPPPALSRGIHMTDMFGEHTDTNHYPYEVRRGLYSRQEADDYRGTVRGLEFIMLV